MALLLGFLLALAVALAGGGRVSRLADVRIRGLGVFYAALGLQLVAFPTGVLPWAPGDRVATWMSLASYGCLVVGILCNLRLPGARLLGLGMGCNLVAILANGGHMPSTAGARRAAGIVEHGIHNNSVALADPRLPWLVDRFALPHWMPLANVFSVGDALIVAGAVVLLWRGMGAKLPGRRQQPLETGLAGGPSGTP
jgi:Family of unknown function (DUF5317)